ncbi:MAG TPA: alpha/beta hydrolase [Ktedonobacterales bacterium]|nr:alpha/beta hydrolase [Ktedonobacterales bacterium]
MSVAEINGTALYYEDSGAGQPLLFIHGMCGDASVWSDQVRRLSSSYRCVAYDRRGHTRSPLGDVEQRTVQLHADDAALLIETLGLAPCVLVGSSGGARIAFDVVRRYPHLVRGAVLSEPPLMALDPERAREFLGKVKPAVEAAIARGGAPAAVDAFFEIVCPGLWTAIPEAAHERYRANSPEMLGDLLMPEYQVARADLAQMRTPCLGIRGSESLPIFRSVIGILTDGMPNCQLAELEGSGHVTYFEKPAEFEAMVRTFAERL